MEEISTEQVSKSHEKKIKICSGRYPQQHECTHYQYKSCTYKARELSLPGLSRPLRSQTGPFHQLSTPNLPAFGP